MFVSYQDVQSDCTVNRLCSFVHIVTSTFSFGQRGINFVSTLGKHECLVRNGFRWRSSTAHSAEEASHVESTLLSLLLEAPPSEGREDDSRTFPTMHSAAPAGYLIHCKVRRVDFFSIFCIPFCNKVEWSFAQST